MSSTLPRKLGLRVLLALLAAGFGLQARANELDSLLQQADQALGSAKSSAPAAAEVEAPKAVKNAPARQSSHASQVIKPAPQATSATPADTVPEALNAMDGERTRALLAVQLAHPSPEQLRATAWRERFAVYFGAAHVSGRFVQTQDGDEFSFKEQPWLPSFLLELNSPWQRELLPTASSWSARPVASTRLGYIGGKVARWRQGVEEGEVAGSWHLSHASATIGLMLDWRQRFSAAMTFGPSAEFMYQQGHGSYDSAINGGLTMVSLTTLGVRLHPQLDLVAAWERRGIGQRRREAVDSLSLGVRTDFTF